MELFIDMLRWAAAASTMVASIMVAYGKPNRLVAWGFALFTFASVTWITSSLMQDKPALLSQNVVLLCVNVWGLVRWWRREG